MAKEIRSNSLCDCESGNIARPVLTKADFVVRYTNGEFGNCAPTWRDLNEFLQSGYRGLVHIRNRIQGGPTWYNLSPEEAHVTWSNLLQQGVTAGTLYISAMCPTEKTIIQGELQQSVDYIDLTYTTVVAPMRDALRKETKHANGIRAVNLLKWGMDPASYDWLSELLSLYPDHIVEFTCLAVCWGTVPNRNTIFWEIRKY